MKALITILLLCASTGLAYSEEQDISKPPYFYLQGSVGNNAGLAMRCYGEAPYKEIDCSFVQVQVSASTPEQTAKTKKETLTEIEKIKKNEIEQFTGIQGTPYLITFKIISQLKSVSTHGQQLLA
ncbi:hypothetical protein [Geobacter pickeringii]|uniref:Uncharacterized protein n=1 Tax=Geobacter pickeringii TaxID=345632 RepID=A0A0B5BCH3_9BACT|nr:hypothetical protein [Geobacter pickeringii]AJE04393.1 hypothetical protein GPICK_14440 [Geobacter pickeringii]